MSEKRRGDATGKVFPDRLLTPDAIANVTVTRTKDPVSVALGSRGGKVRAARLSKSRRSEIARQAAQARWSKEGTRLR